MGLHQRAYPIDAPSIQQSLPGGLGLNTDLVQQQHFVVISSPSLVVTDPGPVLVASSPARPGPCGGAAGDGGGQVCQETADLAERDRDEAAARTFGAVAAVTAR